MAVQPCMGWIPIKKKKSLGKRYDAWYMLFGICLHTSCKPKFWHKYMITYFNFIIVKPWLGPYFKIRWWQYWNDGNKRMVWFTQGLFFKKYHIWLYLLILLKKECISFHFISHWYPAQLLKELWNCIYFMHYLVTISFNMGLYKPSFSTDSFGNLVYIMSNWIQCNLNKLYNIYIA